MQICKVPTTEVSSFNIPQISLLVEEQTDLEGEMSQGTTIIQQCIKRGPQKCRKCEQPMKGHKKGSLFRINRASPLLIYYTQCKHLGSFICFFYNQMHLVFSQPMYPNIHLAKSL